MKRIDNDQKTALAMTTPTVIVVGLVLLTASLGTVVWFCITGLQENDQKMRQYKVKAGANPMDGEQAVEQNILFPNRKEVDEEMPHLLSQRAYERGDALVHAEKYQEAIRAFDQSIELFQKDVARGHSDPDDDNILSFKYKGLATCYYCLKNYNKSLSCLNKAIKLQPNSSMNYYYRSRIYGVLGQTKLAEADSKQSQSVKAHPNKDKPRTVLPGLFKSYDSFEK